GATGLLAIRVGVSVATICPPCSPALDPCLLLMEWNGDVLEKGLLSENSCAKVPPMQEAQPLVLYESEDGQTHLDVRMGDETIWLTQAQMSDLFERERSVLTKHIRNVFREGELDEKSNVQILHIARSDRPIKFYSLDVIISVGYRVKSRRGTQFRIWANRILKDYLMKGVAFNVARLNQLGQTIELMNNQHRHSLKC
ncbi:MAG: RhuM family protein, partial [Akkermansia sp.]